MPVHVIKKNQHIAQVAAANGFLDFMTIWEDGANAELRALRKNPHVLFEGDELTIPERVIAEFSRPTGKSHKFVVNRPKLTLRMRLLERNNLPKKEAQVRFSVPAALDTPPLATDGDGKLEVTIDSSAEVATLELEDQLYLLKIGGLDPISEEEGWVGRLTNLGYPVAALESGLREEDELRSAIEEFQCDNKLKVTGERDPGTEAKLLELHGS